MALFNIASQASIASQEFNATANAYNPLRDTPPGFFEGTGAGALSGLQTGVTQIGLLAHDIGAAESGGESDSELQNRRAIQESLDSYMPNPQTTGWLGQVVHGVASIVPAGVIGAMTGGAFTGAGLIATTTGHARTAELLDKGVDAPTAKAVGLVEGGATGGSLMLPAAIPGGLATRIASGAAINTSAGAAQRGATGKILADNGYNEMAEQYRALDGMALLTDSIIGGAFGGMHRPGAHTVQPLPSEIDAALAANNVHQLEIEAAPGIPADIQTRNAHIAAAETATGQLLRGEEVNVAQDLPPDMQFVLKEGNPEIAAGWDEAIKESGLDALEADISRQEQPASAALPVEDKPASADLPASDIEVPESLAQSLADLRNDNTKRVPEPETLTQYIARNGGIKDESGEVSNLGGAEWHKGKPFQKKLIKENGLSLDDMALTAWESGFFPELSRRPTLNEFLDALEGDMKGFAARQRPEDVTRYESLNGQQAYLDDLRHELDKAGIDYKKLSDKEVAGELDKLAKEQQQQLEAYGLQDIMKESPGMAIPYGDEMLSIKDAWAKSNDEIGRAQKESSIFNAAVNCFLRFGDEG